jgi:hypothetical protein
MEKKMDTKRDLNEALDRAKEQVETAENREAVEDLLDKTHPGRDLEHETRQVEELGDRVSRIKE